MLTINAISPVSALLDPAVARPGGDLDGFAPVLASLLTPGEATAPTLATPPVAKSPEAPMALSAAPDALTIVAPSAAPEIDATSLPFRQAGIALPLTGTPPPRAAALPAGEPPAPDDARLLVPGDMVDTVPVEETDTRPAIVPQRPPLREPQPSLTPTLVTPPPPRQASPANDQQNQSAPIVARTSPERPVETDESDPTSDSQDEAAPFCTTPDDPAVSTIPLPAQLTIDKTSDAGGPVASAIALSARPIGPAPTASPAPTPAQERTPAPTPSEDRRPSGPAPVTLEPPRGSPATSPAHVSAARPVAERANAVPQGGVSARAQRPVSMPGIGNPDPMSAAVATEAKPQPRVAAPQARDTAVPAAPTPVAATVPDRAEAPAPSLSIAPSSLAPGRADPAHRLARPNQTAPHPTTHVAVPAALGPAPQAARSTADARPEATPALAPATALAPAPARPASSELVERRPAAAVPVADQVASAPAHDVAAPLPAVTRAAVPSPPDDRPVMPVMRGPEGSSTSAFVAQRPGNPPRPPIMPLPGTATSALQATPVLVTASLDHAPPAPTPTPAAAQSAASQPMPQAAAPKPDATASAAPSEPVATPMLSPAVAPAPPATAGLSDVTRPASAPQPGAPVADTRPLRAEPAVAIAAAPAPPVGQPAAAAIMPAFQAFGAALHRAAAAERRPAPRDLPELLAPAPAIVTTQAAPPVTDPAPLDTTQPRWPDAMIGRIEQLRDLANEADTRIRLHPDALGAVDVALRREGDAVRVQFAAAEPATRTLLADAQPRLQELAESRGLKLGGAALDSGGANTGERRQPATPQSATPARPRASGAAAPDTDADTRLA